MIFFSHFFPFTGDSGIRISLPDEGSPFFVAKSFFLNDELIISVNSRSKSACMSII
jgi:hypothetical protein